MLKIAIISDTHGSLDSKIFQIVKDTDVVIHAGDIGNRKVLEELEGLATVHAVSGNMDGFEITEITKSDLELKLEGFNVYVSHKGEKNNGDFDIHISGHTHIPHMYKKGRSLYLNPGSANPSLSKPKDKPSLILLKLNDKKIINSNIIFF